MKGDIDREKMESYKKEKDILGGGQQLARQLVRQLCRQPQPVVRVQREPHKLVAHLPRKSASVSA